MRKRAKLQPEVIELKAELKREQYKHRYISVLKSTVYTLVVVAAFAILVATLWMPVLQIYGSSMTPTLHEGQIVLSLKSKEFQPGDLIAFYIGNKVLVKRVIAKPADMVSISDDGVVRVNSTDLDEPYVSNRALGECDLEFPYQVPEARYFVMGDHRETSIDSRSNAVGCISDEQIVGRIVFCLWPLADFGPLSGVQYQNDVH
ncbi:MAG: signal peptidase I [Clostridia bacterium]|nr:signal peptidase I [Clostridia bacterium]